MAAPGAEIVFTLWLKQRERWDWGKQWGFSQKSSSIPRKFSSGCLHSNCTPAWSKAHQLFDFSTLTAELKTKQETFDQSEWPKGTLMVARHSVKINQSCYNQWSRLHFQHSSLQFSAWCQISGNWYIYPYSLLFPVLYSNVQYWG